MPSLGPEQGAHRSHTRVRGTCLWPRGHGTARGSQEECGQASGIFLQVDVWVLGHRRGIRGGGIACAVRVACRLWKLGELPLNIHAYSSSHAQDVHSWVTRARRVVDPHTHHLQSNLGVSSLPPAKTPDEDVTSLNFYSHRAPSPHQPSQHDKACEIFAQIKGGVVDYGEKHSEEHGHIRYGRAYPGLFPEWSEEHPIHLVGHSLGGATARMLQHLLHKKAFAGFDDTSAGWVSSITAINSPLNGALGAYALGLDQQTLDVRTLSCGWLLGRAVHIAAYLGMGPLGLEHWRLAWWEEGALSTLCEAIFGRSLLVDGRDNAASDTSIHSVVAMNALLGPGHPNTYHLSFVGDGSLAGIPPNAEEFDGSWLSYALALCLFAFRRAFLSVLTWLVHRADYSSLRPFQGFNASSWNDCPTDGLCATMSQSHPHTPGAGGRPARLPDDVSDMKPGVWSVVFHNHDHMGIVPLPSSASAQRNFFKSLFSRLRALPTPPSRLPVKVSSLSSSGISVLPRAHSLSDLSDASTCSPCGGARGMTRFSSNGKSFGSLAESTSCGSMRALSGLGSSNSLKSLEREGSCSSLTLLEPRTASDEGGLNISSSLVTA